MTEILCKQEVYKIAGAAMAVYNELGPGFLVAIYQEALEIELAERGIPFQAQQELVIMYKGHRLKKTYIADLVGYGQIIVELKAVDHLTSHDESQLLNYLKATGLQVGMLINFGAHHKLEWTRRVRTERANGIDPH